MADKQMAFDIAEARRIADKALDEVRRLQTKVQAMLVAGGFLFGCIVFRLW
jgi:hypothetical protein